LTLQTYRAFFTFPSLFQILNTKNFSYVQITPCAFTPFQTSSTILYHPEFQTTYLAAELPKTLQLSLINKHTLNKHIRVFIFKKLIKQNWSLGLIM